MTGNADWYTARPLSEEQKREALEDLTLIARGKELDLPWAQASNLA